SGPFEKQKVTELVDQEDPDLLDWYMEVTRPPRPDLTDVIKHLKFYVHSLSLFQAETQLLCTGVSAFYFCTFDIPAVSATANYNLAIVCCDGTGDLSAVLSQDAPD